jgi:hypothetical protein
MIAAILPSGIPVAVEEADANSAFVRSLGRDNLGHHYVGGEGYTASKSTFVEREDLSNVTTFDPHNCDALRNWMDAMTDVDNLADDHAPETTAALMIEDLARQNFVEFLHEHSLARAEDAREITPTFPQFHPEFPPADLLVEDRNGSHLPTARVAVNS